MVGPVKRKRTDEEAPGDKPVTITAESVESTSYQAVSPSSTGVQPCVVSSIPDDVDASDDVESAEDGTADAHSDADSDKDSELDDSDDELCCKCGDQKTNCCEGPCFNSCCLYCAEKGSGKYTVCDDSCCGYSPSVYCEQHRHIVGHCCACDTAFCNHTNMVCSCCQNDLCERCGSSGQHQAECQGDDGISQPFPFVSDDDDDDDGDAA